MSDCTVALPQLVSAHHASPMTIDVARHRKSAMFLLRTPIGAVAVACMRSTIAHVPKSRMMNLRSEGEIAGCLTHCN